MFEKILENTIGYGHKLENNKPLVYMDWTASGRLYAPIEDYIVRKLGPLVANTHTETSYAGKAMTQAYHQARDSVKKHINGNEDDALLFCGTGMTGAVHKFQRIMGLVNGPYKDLPAEQKPLVIITHMEHHSNHTSWLECDVDLVILEADSQGLPSAKHLQQVMECSGRRPWVLGAFSACSNVTGIHIPYQSLAKIVKDFDGKVLIDFAASAPYVDIDMHPDQGVDLDVVVFSPHKCLGGPGSAGVLCFSKDLYHRKVPDAPGGGTVKWTNPWGQHSYFDDIEAREDGGTPGFLQAIKVALALKLKDEMTVDGIQAREHELNAQLLPWLQTVPKLHVLAPEQTNRLAIYSVYFEHLHYNLVVRLLSDKYGIQVRGGCACAGTYGHWLLEVSQEQSRQITDEIEQGDLSHKPGWVRISLHPTTTKDEVAYLQNALLEISAKGEEWAKDYEFMSQSGEYIPKTPEASVDWLNL